MSSRRDYASAQFKCNPWINVIQLLSIAYYTSIHFLYMRTSDKVKLLCALKLNLLHLLCSSGYVCLLNKINPFINRIYIVDVIGALHYIYSSSWNSCRPIIHIFARYFVHFCNPRHVPIVKKKITIGIWVLRKNPLWNLKSENLAK